MARLSVEDKTYVGAEKNKLVVEKIPGKYFTREVYSTGAGDGHYYTDYLNPLLQMVQRYTQMTLYQRQSSEITTIQ